jgi:hypothetical protein
MKWSTLGSGACMVCHSTHSQLRRLCHDCTWLPAIVASHWCIFRVVFLCLWFFFFFAKLWLSCCCWHMTGLRTEGVTECNCWTRHGCCCSMRSTLWYNLQYNHHLEVASFPSAAALVVS